MAGKSKLFIISAIVVVIVVIAVISFVYISGKQKSRDDYLSLKIWDKEEAALSIIKDVASVGSLLELKDTLNKAAALFKVVEAEISRLALTDPDLVRLNQLQVEICKIYQDTADRFSKSDPLDTQILSALMQADARLKEFAQLANIIKK